MHIWTILWQSVVIFLCIYLPVKYFQVKKAKKVWRQEMQKKVQDWIPIETPPNEKYIIVRAKELLSNDVIIHNGLRFSIEKCGCGKGAFSYDFGDYFWVEGKFINTHPLDPKPNKTFWLFQNSPTIKCVNE